MGWMRRAGSVVLALGCVACGAGPNGGAVAADPAPVATAPVGTADKGKVDAIARDALLRRIETLPATHLWKAESVTPLGFTAYQPRGLIRVGETWFMSAVEATTAPEPGQGKPPFDRSPGAGRGHLIAFGDDGVVRRQITLGQDSMYAPGGIDFDGERLWVPVAEHRPRGRTIVYTVEPETLEAREAFRVPVSVQALAVDRSVGHIVTASWGARAFRTWSADGQPLGQWTNRSFYLDYRDCAGLDHTRLAVCGGSGRIVDPAQSGRSVVLGGIEVVDLAGGGPQWQVPMEQMTPGAAPRPMTAGATWCTFGPEMARCAFVPGGESPALYRYSAAY